MTNLLEAIGIIREKSESGKLIIFVGSGVSRNVKGLPSWNDLVKAMAKAVGYSKCDVCRQKEDKCDASCRLKDSYSNDEYLKIPQYLYNQDKKKYNKILAKYIKGNKVDAPLSSAIFDLNPVHIITTNYDTLLESSSNELCSQYKVVIEDKDLLVSDASKYIIKMHGDINNKNSIVLKEQDYLEFSQRRVLIELFVKALLTNHMILFLGYSLNDYNIKLIISWLNFMRQQNDALEGKNIGYLVLDEEAIGDIQQTYIEKNHISVLNLRHMPLVENIPTTLSEDVGKRLYSFLKVIHNPSLESTFDYAAFINSITKKIDNINFVPYNNLLNLLKITKLKRTDNTLTLHTEKDFARLQEICEHDDIYSKRIKQLMLDNGIYFIEYWNEFNLDRSLYTIATTESSTLFSDDIYKYYLSNNYKELLNLLESEQNNFKKDFYQHFITYYTKQMWNSYHKIAFYELNDNAKLIYLYNYAVLDSFRSYRFDLTKLSNYLDNITSKEKQKLYSLFKEIANGFKDKKIYLKDKLEKLKTFYSGNTISTNSSLIELYNIKSVAIEVYNYYFYNTLFCEHLADIKAILSIYIEAIFCTNGTYMDRKTSWLGFESKLEKYSVGFKDWDIITKFISTKSLIALINKYDVDKISLDCPNEFILETFKNLIESINYAPITYQSAFWATITNSIVLISYLDFTKEERDVLEKYIESLLSNEKFIQYFFSVNFPDYHECLYHLAGLCQKVVSKNHIEIFERIISAEYFFDYMININQNNVRALINSLLINPEDSEFQKKLFNVCMGQKNTLNKIRLIWLIQNKIIDNSNKQQISDFLYQHFTAISNRYLIDFILSDLIDFTGEKINEFLNDVIKLDKEKHENSVHAIPDPLESKLEVLYILIIFNKINDISALNDMYNKPIYLEFLLSPDEFNYGQVDFSDYIWQNLTKKEEFLAKFIGAKEFIKPKIMERLRIDAATDFEKRMLYGYFLDKDELLN